MKLILQLILKVSINVVMMAGLILSFFLALLGLPLLFAEGQWIYLAVALVLLIAWGTLFQWVEHYKGPNTIAKYCKENLLFFVPTK